MGTNDIAVTAAEYAAGLRALADFLEAAGLPASVRFPSQPLGIQLHVTSADAVKDYALAHDLPVTGRRHTTTVVALGPSPDTYYDGSIEFTVVYVPDEAEDTAAEEPEATGVDTYDCPEPDCDFNVNAVGPQDPDEPDYYAEEIEAHKRGHQADEPVGALASEPGAMAARLERPTVETCPRCAGTNGSHGKVHVRHGNGGGHNEPCPNTPALVQLDQADAAQRLATAVETFLAAGVVHDGVRRQAMRQALADFREATR